jgi:hypothetical protein
LEFGGFDVRQTQEELVQVCREGRSEPQSVFVYRMSEGKFLGVQEHSWQTVTLSQRAIDPAFTVRRVANDLVGRMCQVAADLMATAGKQPSAYERHS